MKPALFVTLALFALAGGPLSAQGGAARIYRETEVDSLPLLYEDSVAVRALGRVLRADGDTAAIPIRIVVRADGTVDPTSIEVRGEGPFDIDSVRAALGRFRWRPATLDGQPVSTELGIRHAYGTRCGIPGLALDHQRITDRRGRSIPIVAEGSPVETLPELTNLSRVSALLARNYPPTLRDAGVEGRVVLEFRVDSTGRVDPGRIQVVSASHDAFRKSAMEVLRGARFRPARIAGRPVAFCVEVPLEFRVSQ